MWGKTSIGSSDSSRSNWINKSTWGGASRTGWAQPWGGAKPSFTFSKHSPNPDRTPTTDEATPAPAKIAPPPANPFSSIRFDKLEDDSNKGRTTSTTSTTQVNPSQANADQQTEQAKPENAQKERNASTTNPFGKAPADRPPQPFLFGSEKSPAPNFKFALKNPPQTVGKDVNKKETTQKEAKTPESKSKGKSPSKAKKNKPKKKSNQANFNPGMYPPQMNPMYPPQMNPMYPPFGLPSFGFNPYQMPFSNQPQPNKQTWKPLTKSQRDSHEKIVKKQVKKAVLENISSASMEEANEISEALATLIVLQAENVAEANFKKSHPSDTVKIPEEQFNHFIQNFYTRESQIAMLAQSNAMLFQKLQQLNMEDEDDSDSSSDYD